MSKARRRGSLSRLQPSIQPRECVLIVAEGEKTEPNYFQALKRVLRLSNLEVRIVGEGAPPKTVVAGAIRRKHKRRQDVKQGREGFEFDRVWCVIDVERPGTNLSLPDALTSAQRARIDVALSNPCFEFWYLLHFERRASAFERPQDAVRALKEHLPRYDKADPKVAEAVIPLGDEAIARARDIEKRHEDAGTARIDRNPNTEVYKLVEYLQQVADQRPY